MTNSTAEPPAGAAGLAALDAAVTRAGSRWPTIIGAVLTLAMVVGVARALMHRGVGGLVHALPQNPLFYAGFLLLYLALPLGDYLIFRRLWGIPLAGLVALIKKRIANEVVLGYAGEAYFYAWARQRARMVAAPFGAVKDVSILSAIAGNAMTLAITLAALPFARGILSHDMFVRLCWSTGIVIAMSLPFLIFSKRVFSLPRPLLWWIFLIHMLRLVASSLLLALTWHFAMPQVAIGTWLLLSAGRMLASRLPLPNKDLLFANFTILLIGQGEALATLMAVTAALTLLVHVVVIVVFGVFDVLRKSG